MGAKKARAQQAAAQQAALAQQSAAAQAAAAQQTAYQAQLSAQNQQYSSLLTETQAKIADASKVNVEAPAAQLVGGGTYGDDAAARKKAANRFGLGATMFAGRTNRTPMKSLLG
jgi:hypothetical protein